MIHLGFAAALAASALFFALLEVQIEGPHGWARDLPTWRIDNRWTRLVFGSRPVTGYHLYAHLFLLVVLHLPYALGFTVPSLAAEARIAAFWVGFWILENYLWFVFNPAFWCIPLPAKAHLVALARIVVDHAARVLARSSHRPRALPAELALKPVQNRYTALVCLT